MHASQWAAEGKLGHFGDWPHSEAFNTDLVNELSRWANSGSSIYLPTGGLSRRSTLSFLAIAAIGVCLRAFLTRIGIASGWV